MTTESNVSFNPALSYEDPEKAIQFLREAFGFNEHAVHRDDDGNIDYVELEFGGAYVGFGPNRGVDSPFELGPTVVYVAVDHVDGLHERAVAAGAEIVMPPTDQDYGSRDFSARDPEGNVWAFGTYRPGSNPS